MKLNIIVGLVEQLGHHVAVQVKGDETKIFPASNRDHFISLPGVGPNAMAKPAEKDVKQVIIGGKARVQKPLTHDAVVEGPKAKGGKRAGELVYPTWPQQVNLAHPDAIAAIQAALEDMTGQKFPKADAEAEEQDEQLQQTA